jgi:hypothetical protein
MHNLDLHVHGFAKALSRQREEKVRLKGKYEEEKEAHEIQLARRKDMARA